MKWDDSTTQDLEKINHCRIDLSVNEELRFSAIRKEFGMRCPTSVGF